MNKKKVSEKGGGSPVKTRVVLVLTFLAGSLSGLAVDRFFPLVLAPFEDVVAGAEPLYVHWQYAWMPPCGHSDVAVYTEGDPYALQAKGVDLSPPELLRTAYAAPWESTSLRLTLSATHAEDTLLILDISPVVYEYEEKTPTWVAILLDGGCGSSTDRVLEVTLRAGAATIVDHGVVDSGLPAEEDVPSEPLGETFTISSTDTYDLRLKLRAEDGLYSYGIKIDYMLNGHEFSRVIGTKDAPLRIGGGDAPQIGVSFDGEIVGLL